MGGDNKIYEADAEKPAVSEADWEIIFSPYSKGCPSVPNAIPIVEVRKSDICTGKMHGVWNALEKQDMPMIRCHPVDKDFLMRVMVFMGTWYKANLSGMFSPNRPSERDRISARRIAAVMREPEQQVAYAMRLLAIDDAIRMYQVNGKVEFSFNKLFA